MANKDGDDGKVNSSQEETKTIFSDQIPTAFSDPFSTLFDTPSESHDPQIKTSTLGFIDMLEIQDYTPSIFDMIQSSTPLPPPPPPPLPPQPTELASPSGNSTNSISSISSTEMMAPQTGEEQEQEQEQDQEEKSNIVTMSTKHDQLKPKKKNTKRQRQPRFAFMTKSDVDHLDDGYRWRKYGQKAVKNSPYPRSYYRCTMASCGVKKRVERSSQDSTIVVTTYEGTHGHPCPVTLRTTTTITSVGPPESATFLGGGLHFPAPNSPNFINIINPSSVSTSMLSPPQPFNTTTNPLIFDEYYNYNNCPPFSSSQSSSSSSSMVRDHGLLQDMIMPSQVRKESEDHDHHTS